MSEPVPGLATEPAEDGPGALVTRARAAAARLDWTGARAAAAALRAADPARPAGYLIGIEAALRLDPAEARALEADLAGRLPRNFNARMALAQLVSRRGDWAGAIDRYEAVARDFPRRAAEARAVAPYRQAVLNHHGILEGAAHLPSLAAPAPEPGERLPEPATYAFVSGMPRAGTSALGRLLNASPDVALFTEIYWPYSVYGPASFARSRLEARLKVAPGAAAGNLLDRLEGARVLGDKRPLFHYTLPQTSAALAGRAMVVFHILRPVVDVAASYRARARDPADNWDPLRGLDNCIHELNVMHRLLVELETRDCLAPGHELIAVDYARAFTDPAYARGLFERLGIAITPGLGAQIDAFQARSAEVMARPRTADPALVARLREGLDTGLAARVAGTTGIDILAGL